MKDKTRLTIYLETETHKSLKRIYAETGESVTSLIQKSCEDYLKKRKIKNE